MQEGRDCCGRMDGMVPASSGLCLEVGSLAMVCKFHVRLLSQSKQVAREIWHFKATALRSAARLGPRMELLGWLSLISSGTQIS